ncbi:MAG: hypothetical protein LBV30_01625 [Propionibacteriaceae bacterium]|jgi:hypothetical protein|nr:hypothetical protein [Propionibacteriaceae bacterium]
MGNDACGQASGLAHRHTGGWIGLVVVDTGELTSAGAADTFAVLVITAMEN